MLGIIVGMPARSESADEPASNEKVQELLLSDAVYPQAAGEWQVTVSPRLGPAPRKSGLAVEYGVTDAWQVEFGASTFVYGLEEWHVAAQHSWKPLRGARLRLATGAEFEVNASEVDETAEARGATLAPFVIAAYDIPRLHDLQVFGQVALSRSLSSSEAHIDPMNVMLHMGALVPVGRWRGVFEFRALREPAADEGRFGLASGAVVVLPGSWELGLGLLHNFIQERITREALFKVTYEF